jgi:hypothetical protein
VLVLASKFTSIALAVKCIRFFRAFSSFFLYGTNTTIAKFGDLLGRFQEQRMEQQTVLAASDQELVRLGVSTIGDRVRIREACKKKEEENNASTSQTDAVREERLSIFNPQRHNTATALAKHVLQQETGALLLLLLLF